MPKVRFEIYSTERGKKLIDLAEILVEAGYLQSFHLDEEASEVIFNFEVNVGFDIDRILMLQTILVRNFQMNYLNLFLTWMIPDTSGKISSRRKIIKNKCKITFLRSSYLSVSER
jgi:hypothetical protein